jgi:hypothetical protein
VHGITRDDDAAHAAARLPKRVDQVDAVHPARHVHVREDQADLGMRGQHGKRLVGIHCGQHRVAGRLQDEARDVEDVAVVFNDQHRRSGRCCGGGLHGWHCRPCTVLAA